MHGEDEDAVALPATKKKVVTNRDRNKNPLHGAQAEVHGTPVNDVPIGTIRPNPWNYNVQSKDVFNKLVTSMRRNGFIGRVVVREVEGKPGYQLINGEHRWRAAGLLGLPAIHVDNLGPISDEKAKELTILLNELSGRPDDVRLGDLLRDINLSVQLEDLVEVMPFSPSEMDTYMNAMTFDLASLSGHDTRPPEAKEERDASPMKSSKKTIVVRWGGLSAYDFEKAIEAAKAKGGFVTNEDAILAALRAYAGVQQ